jgi:4-hydroxy-3-methylbut-2-enyl diphosphate reductase
MAATATAPKRVLLAAPRGYCAGVDRAVQTVERALELHGAPVYVRKEIVHNKHVVEELAKRGAIFVEEESEVPEGAIVVFSAHGVSPAVHENAAARGLRTIDATCPLVTKVHVSARRFAAQGYTIIMIGHEGHEEVEGTTGEAPNSIVLIETADEVESLEVPDPDKVAFITQTTLSVDETAEVIAALRAKFPGIVSSKSDDICYATTNRQIAVKQLARECDLVLVIGSTNSSNSNRLVEVAREHGAASHLIDNHTQVQEDWLQGVETVGITSGASAPEELVESLVSFFRERGADDVSELRTVHEDVRFMLPKEIREEVAARAYPAPLSNLVSASALRGAGADHRCRGFGAVGEDCGAVGLQAAVGAFRGENALLELQFEIGDRAEAAGDLRDRRDRFGSVTTLFDIFDLHRGDDRRRDRSGQEGVDVKSGNTAADAAVESEQFAFDADRGLFGELDLGFGGAAAD